MLPDNMHAEEVDTNASLALSEATEIGSSRHSLRPARKGRDSGLVFATEKGTLLDA